jgi:hypothetical protein
MGQNRRKEEKKLGKVERNANCLAFGALDGVS